MTQAVTSSELGPAVSTPAGSPQKRPRAYVKSGVFRVKRALKERGIRALDGRSTAARAIAEWRRDVEADLGGSEALSRQQQTLLDMAAAAVFLLGQIDAWVAARPELIVNGRRKSVAPVVRERIAVADHLSRLLTQLGLERKAKRVPSLQEYVAERAAAAQSAQGGEPA
jgi:hypothetical protein